MGTYYVFNGSTGTQVAVTDDKTGGELPKRQFGTWAFQRDVVLNPGDKGTIGESADVVIAAIKRDGYYLWPHPKDENVLASKDVLNTTFDLDAEKPKE